MKIRNIFLLIFLSLLALASCGRKGALKYPGERKKPNFSHVIDEEPDYVFKHSLSKAKLSKEE